MNFKQRKKEEFEEKFFVKNGEMSVETYMAVWDFISQSISDCEKELKEAFIEYYKGAGEVFFPYAIGSSPIEKEEEMDYVEGEWNEILSLLQKDKENKE